MFKYDLHVHTSYASGCGHNTVQEMMKRYKEIGFSGFALTNHFLHGNTGIDRNLTWNEFVKEYSKGYYEALEAAQKLDFDLLFGIEEGYGNGKEFLVYGISPQILLENPQLQERSLKIWSQTVRENNGFIAYAHPFRNRSYVTAPYAMPDMSLVDGFEGYNYCNEQFDNNLAVETLKDSGKIIIAGGDIHSIHLDNSYGIKTKERIKNDTELVQILKNQNFELYLG